ncbi:MAG: cyclic peptide export ABC transporter [Bacteroidota bacterium]
MFQITTKDVIYLILYAVPNTLFSFGILFIINNVISGTEGFLNDYMWMVFVAVVLYTYLLNIVFQKRLNEYSFSILYRNEKNVFDKILRTPLLTLENLGTQRFYTAVEDLRVFAFLPETITHTVNSLLMLFLCLGYMFTLSVSAALVIVALIVLLVVIYLIIINTMSKQVATLRQYNEDYYEYVEDVTNGFKELGISSIRRNNLMGKFLVPNRDKAEKLDFKINYIFLSINLISQYGLYLVIGVALFLLPSIGLLDRGDIISYVVVLLFISGPINNLINMQNIYTRFVVAHQRIKKFLEDFTADGKKALPAPVQVNEFTSLTFSDVQFSYASDTEDDSFALGPLNLDIRQGETLFIVGGNGSGKSTFIKLLTGLYTASGGQIQLNDQLQNASQEELQQLIAAVFTDNHLFSRNYEAYELENNPRYKELLKLMELDGVVKNDTEEAARRTYSKGQSKRMSLIYALLEDRPVLVLDEWAADQDPHFRKYFYEELLPDLKAQGKTIIAVTHDDAYFKHADRIIKFDYGQVIKDMRVEAELADASSIWYHN